MATAGDVLVVDDDADVVAALVIILRHAGFATRTASNGLEALEAVSERVPAVVLLDVRMPVMDGRECARILRERHGPLPIVVMTAAEHARLLGEEIGADEVVSKPFEVDELVDILRRYAPRL